MHMLAQRKYLILRQMNTYSTLPTPGREASNRQLPGKLFQPVSAEPSYMRLMTQDMIITHEQITLLQHIGQGTCPRDVAYACTQIQSM